MVIKNEEIKCCYFIIKYTVFGKIANMDFLLVCTYEENGENPELVIYKNR